MAEHRTFNPLVQGSRPPGAPPLVAWRFLASAHRTTLRDRRADRAGQAPRATSPTCGPPPVTSDSHGSRSPASCASRSGPGPWPPDHCCPRAGAVGAPRESAGRRRSARSPHQRGAGHHPAGAHRRRRRGAFLLLFRSRGFAQMAARHAGTTAPWPDAGGMPAPAVKPVTIRQIHSHPVRRVPGRRALELGRREPSRLR